MVIYALPKEPIFPDPSTDDVGDIVAIGGDLSVDRLIVAYKNGIFPWYDETSPILWWSPDPRLTLFPEKLHIPKRLKRTLRQGKFKVTVNYSFEEVIHLCSSVKRSNSEGTWLLPEMIEAYTNLHKIGYAHSVETWYNGELVGGLYGVSIGKAFFGESMFHIMSDASKVALVWLVLMLKRASFHLIDCQQVTEHLMRFGATIIPRVEFIKRLRAAIWEQPPTDIWKPRELSKDLTLINKL